MHGLVRPSPRELALQDEVEELRERVRQLEEMLDGDADVPGEWGLTPQEARVVRALLSREMLNKEALFDVADRIDKWRKPYREDGWKLVSTVVSHARAKMRPYGIEIRNKWGFGYYIPADQRKAIRLAEERA